MFKYIMKRLAATIVTLLLLSMFLFALTHVGGRDPARNILGLTATEEELEELREEMGFNKPLADQYVDWLSQLLHGDLGTSYFRNEKVSEAIATHIGPTINLAVFAQIIAMVIAIPLGIIAAKNKGKAKDTAVSSFALLGLSIPGFLLGLFFIIIFSVKLQIFPASGYKDLSYGLFVHLRSLFLPALALGIAQASAITRMTRSSMIEVLNTDYIKTAKAKGVKERVILYKHALRNALIPIITICGQSLAGLIGGSVVMEIIFNIPGLGQLIMNSVSNRDFQVIQGVVIVLSVIYIGINLIVDILYGLADPRIRITGSAK